MIHRISKCVRDKIHISSQPKLKITKRVKVKGGMTTSIGDPTTLWLHVSDFVFCYCYMSDLRAGTSKLKTVTMKASVDLAIMQSFFGSAIRSKLLWIVFLCWVQYTGIPDY